MARDVDTVTLSRDLVEPDVITVTSTLTHFWLSSLNVTLRGSTAPMLRYVFILIPSATDIQPVAYSGNCTFHPLPNYTTLMDNKHRIKLSTGVKRP